jgi:hypothetical protein
MQPTDDDYYPAKIMNSRSFYFIFVKKSSRIQKKAVPL